MRVPSVVARWFWSAYGCREWDRTPGRTQLVEDVVRRLEECGAVPGQRVLDAGCGTGEISVACARSGLHVVAVDFAPGMIRRFRERLAEDPLLPITVRELDLAQPLPWPDGYFDHALAISVVHALPQPAAALRELARVTRGGGSLTVLHRSRPDRARVRPTSLLRAAKRLGDRFGSQYWSPDTLTGMLEDAGFGSVVVVGDERLLASACRLRSDRPAADQLTTEDRGDRDLQPIG